MSAVDVLVLNSGEWQLVDELEATPWHILIYRQKCDGDNELHVWLPREGAGGRLPYAFKRYWRDEDTRWCVEMPSDPDIPREPTAVGGPVRFTAPDGRVLWASTASSLGLGDFTDSELRQLRLGAAPGPYTLIQPVHNRSER